jgi:hypothetical protein
VPREPTYSYYGGTTPGRRNVRQYRDLARFEPPPLPPEHADPDADPFELD